MEITSKQMYDSLIHGAYNVIKNRDILNRINVFPVRDGDTGSNLASMMHAIIQKSERKGTIKRTLESVADASLYGARGNSGLIFAQYFRGLSEAISEDEPVAFSDYAKACNIAAQYAYTAIEKPVEGTMITIMREWGRFLQDEEKEKRTMEEIFTNAFYRLEAALEKTKEQMKILGKANVVDSGAFGFTRFVEGILVYIKNPHPSLPAAKISQERTESLSLPELTEEFIPERMEERALEEYRYCTECLIESTDRYSMNEMKDWLLQKGNSIVTANGNGKIRVHIHTDLPGEIFDYLSKMGRILYQKIDDMKKQEQVVNHRKYDIALVTDSIADLTQEFIDEYQIQIIHLNIMKKDRVYFDKLTIQPSKLLSDSKDSEGLPTSSLPNGWEIENKLDYLLLYYPSVLILTVSKELSGTYNSFMSVTAQKKYKDKKISIINTKQNAGAQGLLVQKCAELIASGMSHDKITEEIERSANRTKILVQVKTLDNMIRSGRLSVKAGKLAKMVGMKPIVTLDTEGKGAIDRIAFSDKGSSKKLLEHIKRVLRKGKIERYNIIYVSNHQDAADIARKMTALLGFGPAYIMETSSIIAMSAGEGAVAVSYLLDEAV